MNIQQWKEYAEQVKVISFDVFDTLLFRKTKKPEDIFDIVEKESGITGFKRFRMKSQHEISRRLLKENHIPHANLEQIYDYMAEKNPGYDWNKIKKLELQVEEDAVYVNEQIFELYQYALEKGKRIIAVSDMYLNGQQICLLLEKCGYYGISNVYSSADLKKTKYEKTIFDAVLKEEEIDKKDIFHTGDNQTADVKNAISQGWKAMWYDGKASDFWYFLGRNVAGNIYGRLYDWLFDLKDQYHCSKVVLLARDGYNMWKLCEKMGRSDVVYLETSRRALLLAGITKLDEESLALLPPYALGQTLEEIFDYLGVREACEKYKEAGFYSLKDVVRTDDDRERVKEIFLLNESEFLKVCDKERLEAKKYFEAKGAFDDNALFFDCGWNGSSQYLIKRFFDALGYDNIVRFAYAGIMDSEKSARQLQNLPYDTFLFGPEKNRNIEQALKKAIVLPELFFGAPHPSIWHYEDSKAVFEHENAQEYKEKIAEGICYQVKIAGTFIRKYSKYYTTEQIIGELIRLIESPTAEEAVTIGNVENADGFVKQGTLKKYIAKLDVGTLRKYPRIEIYWQQGLVKRPDISVIVKVYVVMKNFVKSMVKGAK